MFEIKDSAESMFVKKYAASPVNRDCPLYRCIYNKFECSCGGFAYKRLCMKNTFMSMMSEISIVLR